MVLGATGRGHRPMRMSRQKCSGHSPRSGLASCPRRKRGLRRGQKRQEEEREKEDCFHVEKILLKKITAYTHKENEDSSRLLLNAGFKVLLDQPADTLNEHIVFIKENPSL